MIFGSRSLVVHLARGALGLGALAAAFSGHAEWGWPALLLLAPAFWALRGCPICWTVGLMEILALKVLRTAEG